MNTTATIHDTSRAIVTTAKIEKVYSLAADLENPTGVNAAAVISVPVSIGKAVEV